MPELHEDLEELQSAEAIVHGPAPVLRDVRFFRIHAELVEDLDPQTEDEEDVESGSDEDEEDISVNIGLRTRQAGSSLGIRIEFEASHDAWKVSLDVAAEFEADEPFQTSEAARTDFADKVGVMTLYPYIREAVGNLTQRTVGASFLLPTIRQGQVSFANETLTEN